jgi:hypothetical protein
MTDRHKHDPVTLRLAESDRIWLYERADATGEPVRRMLADALTEYRYRRDGDQLRPACRAAAGPQVVEGHAVADGADEQFPGGPVINV